MADAVWMHRADDYRLRSSNFIDLVLVSPPVYFLMMTFILAYITLSKLEPRTAPLLHQLLKSRQSPLYLIRSEKTQLL